ncbi:MAG TPA: hypothetical protein VHY32_07590 [Caulobacteraceae bacterium]|nr:hypothetical protein [Caulobacteraceae bacterium]
MPVEPMTERARRPLLTLKLGASSATPAESDAAAPAPAPAPAYVWKCRPCGAALTPPADGPDDEAVRCPSCNARLGRAGDFRLDPPPLEKLRARAAKPAPPPPPAPVSTPVIKTRAGGPKVVTVKVLKKVR